MNNVLSRNYFLLENINKKITSFQELKQVTTVFNTNPNIGEKQNITNNNRSKKLGKSKSDS